MARRALLLWFLLPLTLLTGDYVVPRGVGGGDDARQDSLAAAVRKAMAGMTTPALEERKARRRVLQQQSYASLLSNTLQQDGLWALITYTRMSLQLEYSLPRNTLVVYVPVRQPAQRDSSAMMRTTGAPSGPVTVPLFEDRTFPEDPWRK
jgi:hypothetical protein